ncbi:MAG: AAA family ATPase [Thiomargarita sp.]|nr:AAA family ATPase [Thiomargarita sp.]
MDKKNYSKEAEQSVIGGLMLNDADYNEVLKIIASEHFHADRHRKIFRALIALKESNTPFDPITLTEYLNEQHQLKAVGGGEYIGKLVNQTPNSSNVVAYSRIVRKYAFQREQIKLAQEYISFITLGNFDKANEVNDKITQFCAVYNREITSENSMKVRTIGELVEADIPQAEVVINPILCTGEQMLIFSEPGVGKTHFATELALGVGLGGQALKWDCPKARRVLIIDGEMPLNALQGRYKNTLDILGLKDVGNVKIVSTLEEANETVDLMQKRWQSYFDQIIEDEQIEFVIFDNISALFAFDQVKQNEWTSAKNWLLKLKNKNVSAILIHHANREGKFFGTNDIIKTAEIVIKLEKPETELLGNSTHIIDGSFEKHRNLAPGEAVEPFRCEFNDQGFKITESPNSANGVKKTVMNCIDSGINTAKRIAVELEKKSDTVRKCLSRMKNEGLIELKDETKGIWKPVENAIISTLSYGERVETIKKLPTIQSYQQPYIPSDEHIPDCEWIIKPHHNDIVKAIMELEEANELIDEGAVITRILSDPNNGERHTMTTIPTTIDDLVKNDILLCDISGILQLNE